MGYHVTLEDFLLQADIVALLQLSIEVQCLVVAVVAAAAAAAAVAVVMPVYRVYLIDHKRSSIGV